MFIIVVILFILWYFDLTILDLFINRELSDHKMEEQEVEGKNMKFVYFLLVGASFGIFLSFLLKGLSDEQIWEMIVNFIKQLSGYE